MAINPMEIWFIWLARLLFVGIFLMAGGMFYRAWRIAVGKDLRFVADWRGRAFPNPERWAAVVLSVNFIGGGLLLATGVSVLLVGLSFAVWTGVSALVLWSYYFLLQTFAGRARR